VFAEVYSRTYGMQCVGLRYFNVFGPRQDPDGAYAAVIPRWIAALLRGSEVIINGDGETSRDFCYVANAVQANVLAATSPLGGTLGASSATRDGAHEAISITQEPTMERGALLPVEVGTHEAFNVACGERTTLNQLFALIRERVAGGRPDVAAVSPRFVEFRAGDVRHSLADIGKAGAMLGYAPTHQLSQGLDAAMGWYLR